MSVPLLQNGSGESQNEIIRAAKSGHEKPTGRAANYGRGSVRGARDDNT